MPMGFWGSSDSTCTRTTVKNEEEKRPLVQCRGRWGLEVWLHVCSGPGQESHLCCLTEPLMQCDPPLRRCHAGGWAKCQMFIFFLCGFPHTGTLGYSGCYNSCSSTSPLIGRFKVNSNKGTVHQLSSAWPRFKGSREFMCPQQTRHFPKAVVQPCWSCFNPGHQKCRWSPSLLSWGGGRNRKVLPHFKSNSHLFCEHRQTWRIGEHGAGDMAKITILVI